MEVSLQVKCVGVGDCSATCRCICTCSKGKLADVRVSRQRIKDGE